MSPASGPELIWLKRLISLRVGIGQARDPGVERVAAAEVALVDLVRLAPAPHPQGDEAVAGLGLQAQDGAARQGVERAPARQRLVVRQGFAAVGIAADAENLGLLELAAATDRGIEVLAVVEVGEGCEVDHAAVLIDAGHAPGAAPGAGTPRDLRQVVGLLAERGGEALQLVLVDPPGDEAPVGGGDPDEGLVRVRPDVVLHLRLRGEGGLAADQILVALLLLLGLELIGLRGGDRRSRAGGRAIPPSAGASAAGAGTRCWNFGS